MRRKPKTTATTVKALTNPRPSFVSMVQAGANQRPFRAMKEDAPMSIKTAAGYEIATLRFAKTHFPTTASVSAWLSEGGYTDVTVEDTADAFVVANKTDAFIEGTVEEIDGVAEGLTASVGKLVGSEEAAEKTDEVDAEAHAAANPSAVQPVAKSDEEATAKDEAPAAEAAQADAAPQEDSAVRADAEVFVASVKAANFHSVANLSEKAVEIGWVLDDAEWIGLSPTDIASLRSAAKSIISVVASMSNIALNALNDRLAQKSEAPAAETTPASAAPDAAPVATPDAGTEQTTETPSAAPVNETPAADAAPVAETGEVATLRAEIAELRDLVKGLVTAKSDAKAPDDATPVERTDTPDVQTRKGSDATGTPDSTEAAAAREKETAQLAKRAEANLRRSLGLSVN